MSINSISGGQQAAQVYQTQQRPQSPPAKNIQNDQQPEDTVVLSKKATETNDVAQADADHDGH